MTAPTNPAAAPGHVQQPPCPPTAGGTSSRRQRAFPFVGTAGEHLDRVERAIERQRRAHGPLRNLLKRQRVLKARCAALGRQA